MCNSETAWKLDELTCKLTGLVEEEAAKGLGAVSTEEMGEVIDMIKDLSEAKYYCTVVTAMLEDDGRAGYEPRRYDQRRMGYEAARGPEPMTGGDMGAMMRNGPSEGARNGFGAAYDRYREARMGYQHQATADNRRMMEQTADEHMQEFEDSLREIWGEADQRQRNKIKAALVNMANGLK